MNAGHNAPIIFGHGVSKLLEATGLPLGLFNDAEYEARTAQLNPGNFLLLFTDGLTDAIAGDDPEGHLRATLGDDTEKTMLRLQSLVDSKPNRDDVTIIIVARLPVSSAAPTRYSGKSDGSPGRPRSINTPTPCTTGTFRWVRSSKDYAREG